MESALTFFREFCSGNCFSSCWNDFGDLATQLGLRPVVLAGNGNPVIHPRFADQRLDSGGGKEGGLCATPSFKFSEFSNAYDLEWLHAVRDGNIDRVANGVFPLFCALCVKNNVVRCDRRGSIDNGPSVERRRRKPVESEVRRSLCGDERLVVLVKHPDLADNLSLSSFDSGDTDEGGKSRFRDSCPLRTKWGVDFVGRTNDDIDRGVNVSKDLVEARTDA